MQDNEKNQDDAERSAPSVKLSEVVGEGVAVESCQHKPIKMTAVLLFGEREHADTGGRK